MDGLFDNYLSGYQIHLGAEAAYQIKGIDGLSIGAGLETYYGHIGYYDLLRESGSRQNFHNHPVDKSKKFKHRLMTLDIPVRVRYQAFDFMGVLAGFHSSYLIDGYVLLPDTGKKSRYLTYNQFIPVGEAGLFFPVGNRISIVAKGVKALKDRFFNEYYIDANGDKVGVGVYRDYAFSLSLGYRWK